MNDEQKPPTNAQGATNSKNPDDTATNANESAATGSTNASTAADNSQSPSGDELAALKEELAQMTRITQHALADLQNFRRRADEERANYVAYANAALLTELLPVLENMNKALAHEPKDAEWIKGAEATMKQFQTTLAKHDLQPIEALNRPFDPKIHEALMVGPGPKDQVIDEYEKGYMLGDKVLKRTRVRVGNGE
jgi:molecular chaperone GrpE